MSLSSSSGNGRTCSPRRLKWTCASALVLFLFFTIISLRPGHTTSWSNILTPKPTSIDSTQTKPKLPPPLPPPDEQEYLAICMPARDQQRELPEVLQHHYHHHGIRRFYILDTGSQPPLSTQTYGIPSSTTTFEYFYDTDLDGKDRYHIYNECNRRFGSRHTWIGYLDPDEYLQMTGNETLIDLLKTYEHNQKVGALGVNWRVHTSGGLVKRPPEGDRKAFTECIIDDPKQDNRYVKSFIKTEYYKTAISPHIFALREDTITVGENGDKIKTAWRVPITRDKWALHKYGVKSKEQYLEKGQRGRGKDEPVDMEEWDHINSLEHVECSELSKYNP